MNIQATSETFQFTQGTVISAGDRPIGYRQVGDGPALVISGADVVCFQVASVTI